MTTLTEETLQRVRTAAELICNAQKGVVLTGAGSSTQSGIPDFRSAKTGLWQRYDPMEVASLLSFRYHPEKFYNWLRPLAHDMVYSLPNPAHVAIAQLEAAGHIQYVITQNIDGLHQKAGSKNVIEVHGTIKTLTCVDCFQKQESGEIIRSYIEDGEIPRCPKCNGILKPDVILFGEQLPVQAWLEAVRVVKVCDLMLVAGSSLEVMPVANLPLQAIENGAHLIIINHSHTYLDVRADVVFWDDVTIILPQIVEAINDLKK
jgi:NAD-dependent deacetylase